MLLMAAAGLAQAQQLHKWIGPDGRVHYTDSPPPSGARTQEVQIRRDTPPPPPPPAVAAASAPAGAASAPTAAPAPPAAAPEVSAERKKQDEAEKLKQEQAEFAKRRCDQALEQVKRTLDLPQTPSAASQGGVNNFPDRTDRINRAKTTARQICGDRYREL
jgi:hypothetical protein